MDAPGLSMEVRPATSGDLVAASAVGLGDGLGSRVRSDSLMVCRRRRRGWSRRRWTESVSFYTIADDPARRMPEKAVAPTETAIAAAATA